MLPKIGFSLQSQYDRPITQVIDLLRKTGFSAVSPVWSPKLDLETIAGCVRENGMTIQSLHGPLRGLPDLWGQDPARSAPILAQCLAAMDACVTYSIPILVIHSWTGLDYSFRKSDLYFHNFDILVNEADCKGILIAFENLEGPEYLDALMERYADRPNIGFCWDSGHERCYTPDRDYLQEYGHRLIMTHLNDNLGITHPQGILQGTDDLHLLPQDGTVDWEDAIKRLQKAQRQEILNFELKIRPKGDRCTHDLYSNIPLEEYLVRAYADAYRIASAYFDMKA